MVARTIAGGTIRSIAGARLMGTERQPSSMVALPAETTWASGKPRLARTRLEEPVKVSAAAASRTRGEHPHRAGAWAVEETGLAIARLQAGAWAQETAALFPAPPVAVRLEPAVHGALPALAAVAVAAVGVAAGEGVDSLTNEG